MHMENTRSVLLNQNSQAEWFLANGQQTVGPFTATELCGQIEQGKISVAHFVWKQGFEGWVRICDQDVFQSLLPSTPASNLIPPPAPVVRKSEGRVAPPAPPVADKKEWYLYHHDVQTGPFSKKEISRSIQLGVIDRQTYVWKQGLSDWMLLANVPEFLSESAEGSHVTAKEIEKRKAPRKPMVARVWITNDREVLPALCRDVSVGGMQVLTDQMPGKVGTRIKLNITPSDGAPTTFAPFVAEGVVVRLLEDGRGFCFRFENLSADAKIAIERHVDSE